MGAYQPDPVYDVEAIHLTRWQQEGKTMQSVQEALTKLGVHQGVHPAKGYIVIMARLGGTPYNISTRHNLIEKAILDYRQRIHATRSGLALEFIQTTINTQFPGATVGGGVVTGEDRSVSYTIKFPDVFLLPIKPPLPQVPQVEGGTPDIEPIHINGGEGDEASEDAEEEKENGVDLPEELNQDDCVFQYFPDLPIDFNDRIIDLATDSRRDPRLHKGGPVNAFARQAHSIAFGAAFGYNNEKWEASVMPAALAKLRIIAEERTGKEYDIALLKIFDLDLFLPLHQDLGGPFPMDVACFTFASSDAHLRKVAFFTPKHNAEGKLVDGRLIYEFTPSRNSMWFMGGATNAKFSHRVKSIPAPIRPREGIRVSVTFRRSVDNPHQL